MNDKPLFTGDFVYSVTYNETITFYFDYSLPDETVTNMPESNYNSKPIKKHPIWDTPLGFDTIIKYNGKKIAFFPESTDGWKITDFLTNFFRMIKLEAI
jgi:hypothetical protein